MFRKLIIAGILVGSVTAPALAKDYYLIRPVSAQGCIAVPRTAGTGEEKVGGPYASKAQAEGAMKTFPGCARVNDPH